MAIPFLGKFPPRALLTGAGLAKNWNGYLATDIWSQLHNSSAVRGNAVLSSIFNKTMGYFEDALAAVRLESMRDEALKPAVVALEREIILVFFEQEQAINAEYRTGEINPLYFEELLSLFGRAEAQRVLALSSARTSTAATSSRSIKICSSSDSHGTVTCSISRPPPASRP